MQILIKGEINMFGFEKRKEAKRLAEIEAQKEKEMVARMNVKRTLGMMKKSTAKLDTFKKEYIEKARLASAAGNKQTYQLAKSGLKLCLSKQRFLETMIANFEISLEIADMNQVIGDFVKGMNTISEQMKTVTSTVDMTKAQAAYEKALANNAGQYEALDAFLNTAADSIETMDGIEGTVSDSELDSLIQNKTIEEESAYDNEIESKLSEIQSRIKQATNA